MSDDDVTRVLIAELMPVLLNGLREVVNSVRLFRVCAYADDAPMARQRCEELKPDAIILDATMDGAHGVSLMRDFAVLHAPARTLIYSACEDPAVIERVLKAGAQGYISKYDCPGSIIDALTDLRAGRVYLSARVSAILGAQIRKGRLASKEHPLDKLSAREQQVYELVIAGKSTREIAETLGMANSSVENTVARIRAKLNVKSIEELRALGRKRRKS